jgi:hypothetical protein
MARPHRLTRAVVFRVYGVFALLLVGGVAFISLCERYEAHELEVQAHSWDAANNRWSADYDWKADEVTDRRLSTARVGFAVAVIAAAVASSTVSALHARTSPVFVLAAIAFAAFAALLTISLVMASAVGGAGMIGATPQGWAEGAHV